jgi:hypothetical protein
MSDFATVRPQLDRIQLRLLLGGLAVLAAGAVFALVDRQQVLRSYLLGYLFWLGIAVGSLAVLMLHHLAGGYWGFVIRRVLESATRTLPLMALLLVPLLFGISDLYIWARPDVVRADEALIHKSPYLNVPFFLIRAVVYFAIWYLLVTLLNRLSRNQDETGDDGVIRKFQLVSAPGLLLYGGTVTFAAVDWVMSLEPLWYSTIFGVLFMVGQGLSTLAFAIIVLRLLARYEPVSDIVKPTHFHDLGNLMFAFLMLWAYVSFSQFLIIWSGNLPEEITWYIRRMNGGWGVIAVMLVVLHFMLPFVLLLSRKVKRAAKTLGAVAIFVIVLRVVDLFWIVVPSFHNEGFHLNWLDIAMPIGIGGLWLAFFIRELKTVPPLPLRDARFTAAAGGAHG